MDKTTNTGNHRELTRKNRQKQGCYREAVGEFLQERGLWRIVVSSTTSKEACTRLSYVLYAAIHCSWQTSAIRGHFPNRPLSTPGIVTQPIELMYQRQISHPPQESCLFTLHRLNGLHKTEQNTNKHTTVVFCLTFTPFVLGLTLPNKRAQRCRRNPVCFKCLPAGHEHNSKNSP